MARAFLLFGGTRCGPVLALLRVVCVSYRTGYGGRHTYRWSGSSLPRLWVVHHRLPILSEPSSFLLSTVNAQIGAARVRYATPRAMIRCRLSFVHDDLPASLWAVPCVALRGMGGVEEVDEVTSGPHAQLRCVPSHSLPVI
jgi:hypothetical protein